MPTSAIEPLVLTPRVRDYTPVMLDKLLTTDEVIRRVPEQSQVMTAGSHCTPPSPHR
ncbi:hypothetical protein [Mycobacterium leprae]|uniref:Lhr family ATP-dependent helicase n=1 Tax=Mycobacterium leprae TaxID=1769 RepID=UPI000318FA49|nr:hypothetical protein [Mycobacterium leprae]